MLLARRAVDGDRGQGADVMSDGTDGPSVELDRGRGIPIMQALGARFSRDATPRGTTISMQYPLPDSGGAP